MTSAEASQTKVKSGWVLKLGDKFWGETWPADGKCSESYGWTDDLSKVRISEGPNKPPHKGWFTYADNTYEITRMSKGDWVYVEYTVTHGIKPL